MSQPSITVNRADLGNALAFASLGLSRRPVVPVLAGMRVSITCGTLELSAFDYELAARARVSGEASGPGEILIRGAELAAAVKSLPRGKAVSAEITITDGELVISCEGIVSRLGGFDAEATAEYPALPAMPELAGVTDAATFADSVLRVVPCASTDDTLPVLTCVNVTSEHDRLELTATDRYRLARHRTHWTGPDGIGMVVSARTLSDFAKKCHRDGKVEIYAGERTDGGKLLAAFSDGAYTLIMHTCDGQFPKVDRLIPEQADTWVTVEAPALALAVTRAAKVTERAEPIRLDVEHGDNGASVTVRVITDGRTVSAQAVPCRYEGPDVHAGFNPAYLASVLTGVGAGRARLGFQFTEGKVSKPVQVRGTDGYMAIQMPVKLES
jgi:DNA polymerase-3 subunit beta